MPDHTDNLDKIVFDDQNVERRLWSCLGQTCCRSLIVFLSEFLVILLINWGCFWRIRLAKTCDESTVWVEILCSAAGYILFSPNLWTISFLQDNRIFIPLVWPNDSGKTYLILEWLIVGTFEPKFDKNFFFLSAPSTTQWCHAKRKWWSWICWRSTLWIYQLFEKQRYQTSAHFWWLMCRKLQV